MGPAGNLERKQRNEPTMEMTSMNFENKVVLVSGGSQGIGMACVQRFLQAGCRVAIADIQRDVAERAVQELNLPAERCFVVGLDVSDPDQCIDAVAQVRAKWGPIEVLVNNAGIGGRQDCQGVHETAAELDRVLGVNVRGVMNLTLAASDDLKATKGAVVNVASITSFIATKASTIYGVSKGAVAQMTKFLARDLGPYGVRVNAVAPGLVMTPMTNHIKNNPQHLQWMVDRTYLKAPAQPQDIAGPVFFLASPLAAYVTGVVLPVDGGYIAN